ncbi:MAG: hypothetical protein ABEK59_02945 [Halobacteria archaeon]
MGSVAFSGCLVSTSSSQLLVGETADVGGMEVTLTKFREFGKGELSDVDADGEKTTISQKVILVKFEFRIPTKNKNDMPQNQLPRNFEWEINTGVSGTAGGGPLTGARNPDKKYIHKDEDFPSYLYRANKNNFRITDGDKENGAGARTLEGWIPFPKPKPSNYSGLDKVKTSDIRIVIRKGDYSPIDKDLKWRLEKASGS